MSASSSNDMWQKKSFKCEWDRNCKMVPSEEKVQVRNTLWYACMSDEGWKGISNFTSESFLIFSSRVVTDMKWSVIKLVWVIPLLTR